LFSNLQAVTNEMVGECVTVYCLLSLRKFISSINKKLKIKIM